MPATELGIDLTGVKAIDSRGDLYVTHGITEQSFRKIDGDTFQVVASASFSSQVDLATVSAYTLTGRIEFVLALGFLSPRRESSSPTISVFWQGQNVSRRLSRGSGSLASATLVRGRRRSCSTRQTGRSAYSTCGSSCRSRSARWGCASGGFPIASEWQIIRCVTNWDTAKKVVMRYPVEPGRQPCDWRGVLRHDLRPGRGGAGWHQGRPSGQPLVWVRVAPRSSRPRASISAPSRLPELGQLRLGRRRRPHPLHDRAHRPLPDPDQHPRHPAGDGLLIGPERAGVSTNRVGRLLLGSPSRKPPLAPALTRKTPSRRQML